VTVRTDVLNEMWDTVRVIGHGTHKCSQPLFCRCWSRYTQVQPTFVLSVLVTVHTSAANLCSVGVGHGTHKCSQPFFLSVLVTVHTSAASLCSVSVGHGTHKCNQTGLCSVSVGHGAHKCSQPLFSQCWSRYTQVQPAFVLSVLVTICRNYRQIRTGALFNFGHEAKASWKFRNITRNSVLEVV